MSAQSTKYIAFVRTNDIIMSERTANIYARIESDVKEQAEFILSSLGISVSNAIWYK